MTTENHSSPRIVSIYTEQTPNPETMKFVLNKMLFAHNSADFPSPDDARAISPFATALFDEFPYINGVFVMNNFVTVTKKAEHDWLEITGDLREFIRGYVTNGGEIIDQVAWSERVSSAVSENAGNLILGDDTEVVKKIKEMLTRYVQPAVEMDGGTIVFRKFDEGVLTLGMQGSCSGCPSSTVTLKAGIEGLLKRMVPEVQSVEAEMM